MLTGLNGWLVLGIIAGAIIVSIMFLLLKSSPPKNEPGQILDDRKVVTWGMGNDYQDQPASIEIYEPALYPPIERDASQDEYSHATPVPTIHTPSRPKWRPRRLPQTSRFAQVELDDNQP